MTYVTMFFYWKMIGVDEGCGDLSHLDPFANAAEGNIVTKLSGVTIGVPLAVALLLSIFYILNIEYTPGVSNVYVLCIS